MCKYVLEFSIYLLAKLIQQFGTYHLKDKYLFIYSPYSVNPDKAFLLIQ